jgi:hypothetical protein
MPNIPNKILGSRVYIQEKHAHDRYCDGGEIISLNAWGQVWTDPCRYCQRLAKAREVKVHGGTQGVGDTTEGLDT